MNDYRELLELAARALGVDISAGWSDGNEPYSSGPHFILLTGHAWNPGANSGQCAAMCAALGIDTKWGYPIRPPREIFCVSCTRGWHYSLEMLKEHIKDRSAA